MVQAPYFPKYAKDWLTGEGTRLMTPEQRGAFDWLLCHAWLSTPPCTLPDDDASLARLSELGNRWKRVGALIRAQFLPYPDDSGRIYNRKQFEIWYEMESHRVRRSQAGRKGNAARWSSDSHSDRIAIAKPSPSSSSAFASSNLEESSSPATPPLLELPADGVDALDIVLRALDAVNPNLPADEIAVTIWLRDVSPDPWWIAAAILESQADVARARSAKYVTTILENRKADGWACEGAEGYVRHMLDPRRRELLAKVTA